MESIENIAAGYEASGGYGGPAGASGLDNLDSDDRGIAQLAAAQQQVNRMNDIAYGRGENFNNRADLNRGIVSFIDKFGPKSLDRATFQQLRGITPQNPGGRNTLAARIARGLGNFGIGSGQVKTNPNAGRLTGTVFKDGVITKDGKNQGVAADVYYGDRKDTTNEYAGRPRYTDKGYLGAGGVPYANPTDRAINRQYDQFMNPYNVPGKVGYNPDVTRTPDELGQVRPGLRSTAFTDRSGTPTRLGPVATYDRDFSGADNIAMTLAPGGIGFLARALANPVSGIRDQALPAAALAPTEEMLARGETSGGVMRSIGEAMGQGIGALGDAGQGLMNAGTNIGDAFTNAVQNTAEGLVNAGVNTAEAVDAAVRNTIDLFGLDGYSDSKPQVQRQLDDAPLDENMYGSGMFDLGTMAAPLPQSSIAEMTPTELFDLNYGLDRNRPIEDVNQNFDRMAEELERQQRRSREMDRRRDSGTTFDQLPAISAVRSNFPDAIQIADAGRNTYTGQYQGETGLFSPGGSGQTLYGGQKEGSFLDQDYQEQLKELKEKARNVFNYFTT